MKLAYLLSRYPAVSHTFFLQEVKGLRALGFEIQTASINPADRPRNIQSTDEQHAADTTFYIKSGGAAKLAIAALFIALTHPAAALRGLRTVLALPRLTLRARMLWLLYLGEAMLLGNWMRKQDLQHLHVHFGGPVASVGMLTSKAWSIPYSLTIHGPEELLNFDSTHLVEKVSAASFVLCISDFCRSQLLQRLPVDRWPHCIVSRLGVESTIFDTPPVHSTADGIAAPVTVVCTGRLVPEKAQHLLLEATAAVRAQGTDLRVRLIGQGPDRASLEALAKKLGITDAVDFLGALPHAQTLQQLTQADFFALVSFAEGIPVALMEAMALGLPCISTTITGIPELIRNGTDGILVPPSNLEALTQALHRMATDPALRATFASSARQRVMDDYALETNHKKLAAIFREQIPLCSKALTQ